MKCITCNIPLHTQSIRFGSIECKQCHKRTRDAERINLGIFIAEFVLARLSTTSREAV